MKLAVIIGLWLAVFATATFKEPHTPKPKVECNTFECLAKRTD